MFTFLHAADLHLDTPFKGLGSRRAEVAQALQDASLDALDNLIEAALARRVDFVVLAGDLYDGAERGLRAQIRLLEGVKRLSRAGIRTLVVHGNHDPIDEGWTAALTWPEHYHRFPADAVGEQRFTASDGTPVVVHGISYPRREVTENLAARFPHVEGGGFHLALLHANVGGLPDHPAYSPCSLADLRATGHDYWALGHVHTRQTLSEHPHVVYPGNLQGRHAREPGARGAVLVHVDDARVTHSEFLALDRVRFERVDADLDAHEDIGQLQDALVDTILDLHTRADGRGLVLTLRLVGGGPVAEVLAAPGRLEELQQVIEDRLGVLRPFAWCADWQVDLRAAVDLESLREGGDLLATIVQEFEALLDDPEALSEALSEALDSRVLPQASQLEDTAAIAREALLHAVARMQA